jgi:hypothetical protein
LLLDYLIRRGVSIKSAFATVLTSNTCIEERGALIAEKMWIFGVGDINNFIYKKCATATASIYFGTIIRTMAIFWLDIHTD